MTKRPKGIYLVALWVVLALRTQLVLAFSLASLFPHGLDWLLANAQWVEPMLRFLYVALTIYLVVGSIRLDRIAMWIFSGLCVVGSVLPILILILLSLSYPAPSPKLVAGLSTFIVLNIVAVWYLARPSFRSVAAAYRTQREQRRREKYVDDQIRKGAHN